LGDDGSVRRTRGHIAWLPGRSQARRGDGGVDRRILQRACGEQTDLDEGRLDVERAQPSSSERVQSLVVDANLTKQKDVIQIR
jgi:hypothetical protein